MYIFEQQALRASCSIYERESVKRRWKAWRWYRTSISFLLWERQQTCRIQNEIPPCISTRNWSPRERGRRTILRYTYTHTKDATTKRMDGNTFIMVRRRNIRLRFFFSVYIMNYFSKWMIEIRYYASDDKVWLIYLLWCWLVLIY